MKTTRYFENHVLRKRSYLRREWCERVLTNPIFRKQQDDGRIRFLGLVPEMKGAEKILRVVTLPDGETIHNAFPDRDFVPPEERQ